ncbi:hypothetical protein NRIC_11970 [Enterococcus florum]|uniref:VanZ-like domain-containing protein n=1 Tax=Enterococcus florum TaxID=2480627 RepID=A0A4P5P780_9ENTE|nr:VanZ family protein [Enterococcus florum]GCF93306.1 hypothetical protein NRIC_11970 [Enterococcus florum]
MRKLISAIVSGIASYVVIYFLALPTLTRYPRLAGVMERFAFTDEALWLFLFLSLWLFYVQWERRRLSVVYLYLFYSVYGLLLFIVLFTKAQQYHSLNVNPFEMPLRTGTQAAEFLLNVVYFIPLGILYGIRASWKEAVFLSIATILGVETLQYVFYLGTFDIWDIFTNLAGCGLGYLMCAKMKVRFVEEQKGM